jgi:thiamine pyrophosphate-dependent acetolactate synthase large subunit-like protein
MQKEDPATEAPALDRRNFLTGVAVVGAAVGGAVSTPDQANAAIAAPRGAAAPSAAAMEAETGDQPTPIAAVKTEGGRPGSDIMVDVLRSLDIEYVAMNPASSFRGLHESINNYGMNKNPELLTCMHEEIACAMAQGYAKVANKPMATLMHGTVGIQHAAMAVYNAWCDRVPMLIFGGNHMDSTERRPGVEYKHAAQDPMLIIRDFTKWDDQPTSLQAMAESVVRAYKVATTPPFGPVAISLDGHLQEMYTADKVRIPKMSRTRPPQGDTESVNEAARLLVAAENPVIVVDRHARTNEGQARLVEFAELLGAPVVDQYSRHNFPSRHPLNHSYRSRAVVSGADVILGLEVNDFWGTVNSLTDNRYRRQQSRIKEGTKLISISPQDLSIRANYQDFQRYQAVDIAMGADGETTMPALIEAVKSAFTAEQKAKAAQRREALSKMFRQSRSRLMAAATAGWDASPISTARLAAELWAVLRNENWALTSRDVRLSNWPHHIWDFTKVHQFIGDSGGSGQGYGMGASIGAALAHKAHGRLAVNVQGDGDLMYTPGAIWSAVHHSIPLLTIVHNNRAWHQEVMHVQRVGLWRDRGVVDGQDRGHMGTKIERPYVDYATLAKSMGMTGIGPIGDPGDLGPALKRAVAMVKAGEPVLIDVLTQPR